MLASEVSPWSLLESGLVIFPVDDTKRPVELIPTETRDSPRLAWSKHMSGEPAQIKKWLKDFFQRERFPAIGWGIPTGIVNGFNVVDCDTDEAREWWDDHWLEGKRIKTPRGEHILYSTDEECPPVKNTVGKNGGLFPGLDTRGEGGYVVAYSDDYANTPSVPEVFFVLPTKGWRKDDERPTSGSTGASEETEIRALFIEHNPNGRADPGDPATEPTDGEIRTLHWIANKLDSLPRPWHEGANWHITQLNMACWLHRIANTPSWVCTRERAEELFFEHAPHNPSDASDLRVRRWREAEKLARGQYEDPPGDVPILLDAGELVDKFSQHSSKLEQLFYESASVGDVRDLIALLREAGATRQEAYSVSHECRGMVEMRRRNPAMRSTWGWTVEAYAGENVEPFMRKHAIGKPVVLLSDEERDRIRNYPNFIDRYIKTAQVMLPEPNMPLHYLNAWLALSSIAGDRGRIFLENKDVPLSMWGLLMAESGAGKGDARNAYKWAVDSGRPRGISDISLGGDASAQGLIQTLLERDKEASLFMADEATRILEGFKGSGYLKELQPIILDLFDGDVQGSVRVGMKREDVGRSAKTVFNMWLQSTYKGVTSVLGPEDISSGFVGRFLYAIGDDSKVTMDSLLPKWANEYQIEAGGKHPLVDSLGASVQDIMPERKFNRVETASREVDVRYGEARMAVHEAIQSSEMRDDLKGIGLRLTENFLKGAALLALSEGRQEIEMEDLLLALKSGEVWIKSTLQVVDEITSSNYRRMVDGVVDFVTASPKSTAEIMRSARFKNVDKRLVQEYVDRAAAEGMIHRTGIGEKWRVTEGEDGNA